MTLNPTTWIEAVASLKQEGQLRAYRGEMRFTSLDYFDLLTRRISFFWPGLDQRAVCDLSHADAAAFFADAAAGTGAFSRPDDHSALSQKSAFRHGPQPAAICNKMLNRCKAVAARAIKLDQANGHPGFRNPFSDVANRPVRPPSLGLTMQVDWDSILSAVRWPAGIQNGKEDYLHYACTKFMMGTAARVSELLGGIGSRNPNDWAYPGFRWRDIHDGIPNRWPVFTFNPGVKGPHAALKQRNVPFIAGMSEFVEELKARLYRGNPNALVFEGVSRETGVNRPLRRACEKVGLPRIHQQDLRIQFMVKCILAGIDFTTIAEWVGHNNGGLFIALRFSHLRPICSYRLASRVSL